MQRLRKVLVRFGRQPNPPISATPSAIPETERQQLRAAQVRIPRKWSAFDAMIAAHSAEDGFFRGQRR
jgi:hypothetical protein